LRTDVHVQRQLFNRELTDIPYHAPVVSLVESLLASVFQLLFAAEAEQEVLFGHLLLPFHLRDVNGMPHTLR